MASKGDDPRRLAGPARVPHPGSSVPSIAALDRLVRRMAEHETKKTAHLRHCIRGSKAPLLAPSLTTHSMTAVPRRYEGTIFPTPRRSDQDFSPR
jgi:hypothetical protein